MTLATVKTQPATAVPFHHALEQLLAGLAYIDLRVRWAVARARAFGLNPDDEFRGLYISDSQVDNLLGYDIGHNLWPHANGQAIELADWPPALDAARAQWQARTAASRAAGLTLPLERLRERFGLNQIELDALLISLAPELDPRYERLYAYLQDDVTRKRPTVDLVLNLLTDSFTDKLALRRLFTEDGRLLRSRLLICFADGSGREPTLLSHYLRPAARLVEHLLGHPGVDEALLPHAELITAGQLDPLLSGHSDLPPGLADQLTAAAAVNPVFAFVGGHGVGKREAALRLAAAVGRPLLRADFAALAAGDGGLLEALQLLWRDGCLAGALLYLTGWDKALDEDGRAQPDLFELVLDYPHPIIVTSAALWQPTQRHLPRPFFPVTFALPDYDERLRLWRHYLAAEVPDLATVANQFSLTPGQIADVAASARDLAAWQGERLVESHLFAASRAHSNQKLSTLATKIHPRYSWADIVLPEDTLAQLREMVNTVHQRPTVYGEWGFERKIALGKGLNALFAGESGTGKTMSADIMAGVLGLDLYKIDLSSLVSKYIGETEKNLNRIFTEAATSNAILFFDEADAIFGKRSEVKDSHDRYANIEISYLLQRMEAYDGVVILATNMRSNLDDAFTRRLHFIIEFPFPEAADREIIWRVNFPPETPLAADINFTLLAERFRLAGGNIRNIIMAAAFLAAESDTAVGMSHLLHATRREYQKMGRLIDENLFVV